MTDKELRKLSRVELLEMLFEQSKEVARLREELNNAQEQLKSREILIDEAGSIAEAALQVNGIFDVAQEAADQYLDNIQLLSGRQKEICKKIEQESMQRTMSMIEETKQRCQAMEAQTREKCNQMMKKAEEDSREYCNEVRKQLSVFLKQRTKLQELLNDPFSGSIKF